MMIKIPSSFLADLFISQAGNSASAIVAAPYAKGMAGKLLFIEVGLL